MDHSTLFNKVMHEYGFFIESATVTRRMPAPHTHDWYEIYYLLRGDRNYMIEGKINRVCEGDFVLIPPRQLHRTSGNNVSRILISFSEKFLEKYFSAEAIKLFDNVFKRPYLHPSENTLSRILDIFDRMQKIFPQREEQMFIYLAELLQILSESEEAKQTTQHTTFLVNQVVEYIHQHYMTISGIREVAEAFHFSTPYLCKIFKKNMSMTFSQYLTSVRLANASRLLMTTDKKITEIASICGFNTSTYFGNVFRAYYGTSPLVYRHNRTLYKERNKN